MDQQLKKFQEVFSGTITKVRPAAEYEDESTGIFLTPDATENGRRLLRRLGKNSFLTGPEKRQKRTRKRIDKNTEVI